MAFEAEFRHGKPIMVDYVATADVDAGSMILIGNLTGWTLGIAHVDFANGELGALAAGGGVYHCQVAGNYAAGTKVYKPVENAILTTTSTNGALFGFTCETSPAANAVVEVLHQPHV